jgi:hypothetical protein
MLNQVLNFLGESVENPHKHSVTFDFIDGKNSTEFKFVFNIYNLDYKGVVKLSKLMDFTNAKISFEENNKTTKEFKEVYSTFIIEELQNSVIKSI